MTQLSRRSNLRQPWPFTVRDDKDGELLRYRALGANQDTRESLELYRAYFQGATSLNNKGLVIRQNDQVNSPIGLEILNFGAGDSIFVNLEDATHNPIGIKVVNPGTSDGIFINQDGDGIGLNIDHDGSGASPSINVNHVGGDDFSSAVTITTPFSGDEVDGLVINQGANSAALILNNNNQETTLEINNNNDGATAIHVVDDSNAVAMQFSLGLSSATALSWNVDTLTTGKLLNAGDSSRTFTSAKIFEARHITPDGSNADMTGNIGHFESDITDTDTSGTATMDFDAVLIERKDTMNGVGGTYDADGSLLKLESTPTQTLGTLTSDVIGIEMALNSLSASDVYAMKVTNDNAGAGAPGGIDMSTFSVDEPLLKTVADAITTVGTVSHQIAVDIGGTTYYLVAYTHGT